MARLTFRAIYSARSPHKNCARVHYFLPFAQDAWIPISDVAKKGTRTKPLGIVTLEYTLFPYGRHAVAGFLTNAFQCLFQMPILTEYFLNNHFKIDLSKANKKWCDHSSDLLQVEMWANVLKAVFSNSFGRRISFGKFQRGFERYIFLALSLLD